MLVKSIYYSTDFVRQFRLMPGAVQKLAVRKEKLFKNNPFHPSLRFHALQGKLQGLFSISVTINYRIIFKIKPGGDVIFISIGRHDVYRYLG